MTIYYLRLHNIPIFEQLILEETLLRADVHNYFILNTGSPKTIVLGISSKAEDLINLEKAKEANIPILRRYSGGGTVMIEEKTLLTTFILNKSSFPNSPYPEPLMRWSCDFFSRAFKLEGFSLKEQDYAIYERKCAGNAQYLTKDRLVHHTSFLWDYTPSLMEQLLLQPKKAPLYRERRSHKDFLCPLHPYFDSKELLISLIVQELKKTWDVKKITKEGLLGLSEAKEVRYSTSHL